MNARYKPLTPYTWPQDTLKIPNGQGIMPRIDAENGYNVGGEGASYTVSFPIPNTGPFRLSNIMPIEADADFWCSEICTYAVLADGSSNARVPNFKLQFIDIRTGFNLTYPHVRATMFEMNQHASINVPLSAARSRSPIVQPYCFTRNGGVRIELEADFTVADVQTCYITFNGWKEYTFASS